jgi:hypothetical protein
VEKREVCVALKNGESPLVGGMAGVKNEEGIGMKMISSAPDSTGLGGRQCAWN